MRPTRRHGAYTARKPNAAYTARRSFHSSKKRCLHGAAYPTRREIILSTRHDAAHTARNPNAAYTARRSLHGAETERSLHGATQPARREKNLHTRHDAAYAARKSAVYTTRRSLHGAETERRLPGAKKCCQNDAAQPNPPQSCFTLSYIAFPPSILLLCYAGSRFIYFFCLT